MAFVDQPDDAIAEAIGVHNMPLHDAIRFSTGYFCCLGEAFPVDNVQFFGESYYLSTVRKFAQDILLAIVGVADESIVAQVLERIAPNLPSPSELTVRELMTRQTGVAFSPAHTRDLLPSPDQSLIRAVAEAYKPIFA